MLVFLLKANTELTRLDGFKRECAIPVHSCLVSVHMCCYNCKKKALTSPQGSFALSLFLTPLPSATCAWLLLIKN